MATLWIQLAPADLQMLISCDADDDDGGGGVFLSYPAMASTMMFQLVKNWKNPRNTAADAAAGILIGEK